MPTDTNPYGGVFGGWLMGQMALGARLDASRPVGGKAVLVAADELQLPGAHGGRRRVQRLRRIAESGRTSLP